MAVEKEELLGGDTQSHLGVCQQKDLEQEAIREQINKLLEEGRNRNAALY